MKTKKMTQWLLLLTDDDPVVLLLLVLIVNCVKRGLTSIIDDIIIETKWPWRPIGIIDIDPVCSIIIIECVYYYWCYY